MSDLCMYELEDNVWDEFGASDDHIVPHTVDEYGAQFKVQDDVRKKRRHDVTGVTSNANNTTKYGILGEKEKGLHTLIKNRMLEKGSWSHSPDGIFPTSGDNDSHNEATMASDDSRTSSHGLKTGNIDSVGSEFCADEPVLVDKCATEDNNVYQYPLNNMSQTDDDLSFFDNNHEDKENSDLLYYGWADIGNFEDVDRMFRSCDSTFGLGSLSNEDDLCWFSSSQATEGSHDPLKADAKLNSVPEDCATSRPDSAGPSTIDSNKKSVFLSDKISPLNSSSDNAGLAPMSSLNVSNTESESKDDPIPNEQISPHIKQSKQLSTSGERKDQHQENGGSFNHYGNIKEFADVKHPFTNSSCQLFSPSGLQRHKQNIGADSVSYLQTNIPFMHFSYSSPSDQISMCPTVSSTKSENNGHPSSTNESSYASNQVQSIESSRGPSFEAPASLTNEKRGKLYHHQDTQVPLNRNVKRAKIESQMAFCDPVTVKKQVRQSEQDEGHSEVEGVSVGKPAELDSSNAQESSCVRSMLDEVSLEATSFRQLQQVMEKLDIRTKLCIRDSLYRLARSAEQRHNCVNTKGGIGDDKDASGPLVAEETNKCTGFMDMETDTNPIDRSIAHLLFHRPSDLSARLSTDTVSFKSHGMIHGSITSPPVMAEKHIGHEETGAALDKKC
ncbi:PREDICTED: protein LNK1 isoform X1 [Theobroma cacao]|uniref:Protein LNK1 isoform X1 n=1 Tax=Theobroma cacao TaxID=3641 RepID=A0AB32VUQ8_THECC|nr:PREDICTED: protein LNK1 isoform X1 [Theobroma cacao]XP_017971523.1 PREDICTED: protein LNK1 isoform X1 [Theobroma cacao]